MSETYFRRKKTIENKDTKLSIASETDATLTLPKESKEKVIKTIEKIVEEKETETSEVAETNVPAKVEENPVTLSSTKEEIVERVNKSENLDELKNLTNLFGISLTKKEIERASKESDLLDTLLKNAESRIKEKGDYLSNDEILEYMKTFQGNIDKSKKNLTNELDEAKVQIIKNDINVNVNDTGISRESRNKIVDVVNMLLKSVRQQEDAVEEVVPEAEVINVDEEKENSENE